MKLTRKDHMELGYWKGAPADYHRAKMALYLWAFGCFRYPGRVLEIGCGPHGGFLPLLDRSALRVGVDPLIDTYRAEGLLVDTPGVQYIAEHFETWAGPRRNGAYQYDAIFAADSLDHGEMGFGLVPWIAELLAPGGRFYLHVNLRPAARLNAIHDHSLTVEQLDAALVGTGLVELRRDFYEQDVDGSFDCLSLVGVWERPV